MTALLNLDELAAPAVKTIRLSGRDHVAKELTVEEYIARVKRSKAVKIDDEDVASNVSRAVELIEEIFPTLVPALVNKLPLEHLRAVLDFALAQPEEIAKQAEAKDAAGNA